MQLVEQIGRPAVEMVPIGDLNGGLYCEIVNFLRKLIAKFAHIRPPFGQDNTSGFHFLDFAFGFRDQFGPYFIQIHMMDAVRGVVRNA